VGKAHGKSVNMRSDPERVEESVFWNSTLSGSPTIMDSESGGVATGYEICSLRELRKQLMQQSCNAPLPRGDVSF
jgi:hypothetical protein